MNVFVGIMIPFLGTAAGAAMVFFMRDAIKPAVQKMLLGFASGVMIAASVWSLLIPAMDMASGMGKLSFLPAAAGLRSFPADPAIFCARKTAARSATVGREPWLESGGLVSEARIGVLELVAGQRPA